MADVWNNYIKLNENEADIGSGQCLDLQLFLPSNQTGYHKLFVETLTRLPPPIRMEIVNATISIARGARN